MERRQLIVKHENGDVWYPAVDRFNIENMHGNGAEAIAFVIGSDYSSPVSIMKFSATVYITPTTSVNDVLNIKNQVLTNIFIESEN